MIHCPDDDWSIQSKCQQTLFSELKLVAIKRTLPCLLTLAKSLQHQSNFRTSHESSQAGSFSSNIMFGHPNQDYYCIHTLVTDPMVLTSDHVVVQSSYHTMQARSVMARGINFLP